LSVFTIFFSSTISKSIPILILVIASTLTYPIVVMRTVMYDYRGTQKSHFLDTVKHILNESGMKGFYAGLKPDLIRLIPSNAILFIVY
jgi:solute carrier family 25 folate transporter 32